MLQQAAQQNMSMHCVQAIPGGFCAECKAAQYHRLMRLAASYRVRLRLQKRKGLFFVLRPLLRRAGVFAGAAVFGALLWLTQQRLWYIRCSGLTAAQTARVEYTLRSCGIWPGCHVTEQLLTQGEYALLDATGEFSWVSLNFQCGLLTVETADARAVPQIAAAEISELVAKADGVITRVLPQDGTVLVQPGQTVRAGQVLIGTARADRGGELHYRRADGVVLARVDWNTQVQVPLILQQEHLTGASLSEYALYTGAQPQQRENYRYRYFQPQLIGLPLPLLLQETTAYQTRQQTIARTEELATQLARLACEQQLNAAFPDCTVLSRQEDIRIEADQLTYALHVEIEADICRRNEGGGV